MDKYIKFNNTINWKTIFMYSILYRKSEEYILFKCPWNIYKDRPYLACKHNSSNSKSFKSYSVFLWPQWNHSRNPQEKDNRKASNTWELNNEPLPYHKWKRKSQGVLVQRAYWRKWKRKYGTGCSWLTMVWLCNDVKTVRVQRKPCFEIWISILSRMSTTWRRLPLNAEQWQTAVSSVITGVKTSTLQCWCCRRVSDIMFWARVGHPG